MVRRCGVDECGHYTKLKTKSKKKNPIVKRICSYGGRHSSVQFGDNCKYNLRAHYESPRGIAEGIPFSKISSLAGLL